MCDDRIDSIDRIDVSLSVDDKTACNVDFSITTIYGYQLDSQCTVDIGGII